MSHRKPAQRHATREPSRAVPGGATAAPSSPTVEPPGGASALVRHEGRFRSWLAQERSSEARRAGAVWFDICYLSRLRDARHPDCIVTAWSPLQVNHVVYGLDPLEAPSFLQSLALFLDYLCESEQWTGTVVDLANCLALAEEVAEVVHEAAQRALEEAVDDERWNLWHDDEDADREDEALAAVRHRRGRAVAMQQAFREIEQRFGAGRLENRAG